MNKMFKEYSILISTPDMFTPPEDLLCSTEYTWHGAAIMWHCSISQYVNNNLKTNSDRISIIKIKHNNLRLIAASVYCPTSGKDMEYLQCISDLSNLILENRTENEYILLGLDSNCSEKSSARRVRALQSFSNEFDLVKLSSNHATFHHHNGSSESNIDYFLISRELSPSFSNVSFSCSLTTPENLSSHDPVSATLVLPQPQPGPSRTDYSHTYTKFSQHKVVWSESAMVDYQITAAKALSEYEEIFPHSEHIPLKCELYSRILVKSAELCMATKPVNENTNGKIKSSKSLHQAWMSLRKSFKIWKAGGKIKEKTHEDFVQYKKARGLFQKQHRREKELKHIKTNNIIMEADLKNKNEFFRIIKNIRKCKGAQYPSVLNTPVGAYYGPSILEGFTSDAEYLGRAVGESSHFDNEFYKLCILENHYIFEFKGNDPVKIPEMKIEDLRAILNKEMKLGKACDVYSLTVEHLRYSGTKALLIIMKLLNDIITNIYYLTCPQVKVGLSTAVFKGKKKPADQASSYRRITVTPQIGAILDRYIDPIAEHIFQKVQSPDQLGFTSDISYLLGAVERGECQRYAIDKKKTCYGVSFDGEAAFPSVDRDILVRELYSCGERGDLLNYSNNTYKNTASHMKLQGKLGRQFNEYKGARQGHKRASGNFKSYINPCLTATNASQLGFMIGLICVTCICIADDTYVLADDPRKLQAIINIVGHYAKRYRLTFGANKTKVTITGSKLDMSYYKDINIWSLDGKALTVADENEHLGLIVSGSDEEIKNIDKNIDSARKTLFNLLGSIFLYKCKLSPSVLVHIWSLYISPVLRSGLQSLPIRPNPMKSLTNFHHKILRGILKLSKTSPVPSLYFLLGEIPLEAAMHIDLLVLFWCIWANPQTKVHKIVKYLLMMSNNTSVTWTSHLRIICQMYHLPDPLTLMDSQLWPKEKWKLLVKCKVTAHTETKWREKAARNSKMTFFNVQTIGLAGRLHPVVTGILSTQEVMRARVHIRMLSGDFPCYLHIATDRNQDPACRLCQHLFPEEPAPAEDMIHLLMRCRATADTRTRLIPELMNIVALESPNNDILSKPNHTHLTQLVLDPTSLNLPPSIRLSYDHPGLSKLLPMCRTLCYAIHKDRLRQLNQLRLQ